jgi:hypothetical protein
MYWGAMETPTLEEIATFMRVREYFRWESRPVWKDLTDEDVLFKPGNDNARVGGWGTDGSWQIYIGGYFNAARALLEGPPDRFFLQFVIYPALFLYRHYIELEIKGLMQRFGEALETVVPSFGNQHDLLELWNDLRSMLPAAHLALENALNVERVLREFSVIDPRSLDTRYGLRRDLKTPTVPIERDVSVSNLRETMDHLHHEFDLIRVTVEQMAAERKSSF